MYGRINIKKKPDFYWFSKKEIKDLICKKNIINMDTLSVLSTVLKKTKKDQNKYKTINQLKSSSQEEQKILEDNKLFNKTKINSFLDLVSLCTSKKEIELKYELENNVNLVSFRNKNIEISFNENLNKNFIKRC